MTQGLPLEVWVGNAPGQQRPWNRETITLTQGHLA